MVWPRVTQLGDHLQYRVKQIDIVRKNWMQYNICMDFKEQIVCFIFRIRDLLNIVSNTEETLLHFYRCCEIYNQFWRLLVFIDVEHVCA